MIQYQKDLSLPSLICKCQNANKNIGKKPYEPRKVDADVHVENETDMNS